MTEVSDRTTDTLGLCSNCEVMIPSGSPVVRYETTEGWPRMLAECLACGAVVHPR